MFRMELKACVCYCQANMLFLDEIIQINAETILEIQYLNTSLWVITGFINIHSQSIYCSYVKIGFYLSSFSLTQMIQTYRAWPILDFGADVDTDIRTLRLNRSADKLKMSAMIPEMWLSNTQRHVTEAGYYTVLYQTSNFFISKLHECTETVNLLVI